MDSMQDAMRSVPARGWFVVSLLGLLPAVLASGTSTNAVGIVIAVGGILQAQAAFASLLTSLDTLLGASVAWRSIGRLFRAAAEREPPGLPAASLAADDAEPAQPRDALVLQARGVSFRYGADAPLALRECDVLLREDERVLFEGASGGGKSTLASILCGLRAPGAGLVLLRGFDRATIGGAAWRRRVAGAPQFHENHVLSGTLAFNLLMGRAWPPSPQDRAEAETVSRALGLGDVLDRMPSGLDQIVGETGWQLSHGERSRVFLARALLQRADVVILDESFGALDPLTLRVCMEAVIARARTLVVIAHP
jgi:ATP-binding cassette subfamily B protein